MNKQRPIRIFWSTLTNRFYASCHYSVDEIKGTAVITGNKYDVTDQIAQAVIRYDIEFTEKEKTDKQKAQKIDFKIDVRNEPITIEAFNKFIKKWCGSHYAHLIDSDENDGEFMRNKIRELGDGEG